MSKQDFIKEREQKIIQVIGNGELRTVDIAKPMQMDSGTLGGALNAMEKKGMVEKKFRQEYGGKRKRIYWSAR